uniref:Kelch-like protein n=1 Tax=Parastrongyloides trichosuri TaxID=131310 RepID=A0A0N4ZMZ7_PARTI
MTLIQLEVLKRKETIKSDYENNLYYLLDDVRIHNNVSNIGDRLWFIYVTNWFIYCPESKVNDCIVFLDLVTKYEDLCPFEVQNAINEYKNQRRIMTDEVNDDFIKYLKEIYKKVKSFNCTCENCLIFTVLSDDEEEINSMDVPKVMKDSNGKLYGKEYLNFCDSFEEKILLSTSKVDNSQNVSTFSMEIQTEDQTIYDDCRSVSLSSLRDKNSIYQPSSGLYIIGGRYEGKSSKENLIYFNPYDKMTVSMKDCFIDRIGCKAEYKDGKIFLFGGFNSNDEFCTRVKSLNVSSVDVGGKISELDLSLFCDRISHSTILINNDVYVIGGHMNDNSNEAIVKYDLSSETKSVIPVEDDFCVFGHILVEYNKAIYIVGGINQKSENVMTLFDPRDHNVLKKLTPSSIECFKSGVVLNGNIITSMGGLLHEIEHEREYVSDHVMHYDPRANNWIVDETPCLKPFYSGGVFQDGKKCFVFGGYDSNFSPQKVVQVYEKNEWKHSVDLDKPYADFGYVVAPY